MTTCIRDNTKWHQYSYTSVASVEIIQGNSYNPTEGYQMHKPKPGKGISWDEHSWRPRLLLGSVIHAHPVVALPWAPVSCDWRFLFSPTPHLPAPKNYCSFADAGHRLCLSGDTYGLATAARDRCALALCGLQKWSRHPCTGVSIGVPSPHTASESRWTFYLSYYGLFYSLTRVGKTPGNMVPKWIQTSPPPPSIFNFKTVVIFLACGMKKLKTCWFCGVFFEGSMVNSNTFVSTGICPQLSHRLLA